MIKQGMDPRAVVRDMSLVFVSDDYKTNKKSVHWSGIPKADVLDCMDDLKSCEGTLAVWEDEEKIVVAWIEI